MIQVIKEKKEWDNYVSIFEESDLYHTFDYHYISRENGDPVLLTYLQGKTIIAIPLLIRKIEGTSFFDATSVYGYSGPLCNNYTSEFNHEEFKRELLAYLHSQRIISVFSRLNPFLSNQQTILKGIGEVERKGPIVSINLGLDLEQQRQAYARRLKGQLNKIRRHCVVKTASSDEDLDTFINIYHENMDRVNAKPMYYFDPNYFKVLANSKEIKTETFLAIHNQSGKVIGACLFFYKDSVIHYHLSGTKSEYLYLMPTKLLIDEMRIRATELGLNHFNLGGGLAGTNDSLLRFKSSFSKNMIDFCVWKLIVNQDVYKDLVLKNQTPEHVDFFPLYRFSSDLSMVKK